MKRITVHTYKFQELSDSAKERAREWYRRSIEAADYAEHVTDDLETCADLLGIDIKQTLKRSGNGVITHTPTVYWSGFSSQGDGASFAGTWRAENIQPGKLVAHAPQDTALADIAKVFEEVAAAYPTATLTVAHNGHYYHSGCTGFSWDMNPPEDTDDVARTATEVNNAQEARAMTERAANRAALRVAQATRDLMDWYYEQLRLAHDWAYADAQVDESIVANEYDFLTNGERSTF